MRKRRSTPGIVTGNGSSAHGWTAADADAALWRWGFQAAAVAAYIGLWLLLRGGAG